MMRHDQASTPQRILSTSGPGGSARHYRVQCMTSLDDWHLAASFGNRPQAVEFADNLRQRGMESRIVDYAICPVAG